MLMNPHLLPKVRSRTLLNSVALMPCALRISSMIPGHRCAGQDTVVPAHIPTIGKGMSTKVSDLFVAAACLHCHDLIDGRDNRWWWLMENYPAAVLQRMLDGMAETQSRWIGLDLLLVVDDEV